VVPRDLIKRLSNCAERRGRPALVHRDDGDTRFAGDRLWDSRFWVVSDEDCHELLRPRVRGEEPKGGEADQAQHHALVVEHGVGVERTARVEGVEDCSDAGHHGERRSEHDDESKEGKERRTPGAQLVDPEHSGLVGILGAATQHEVVRSSRVLGHRGAEKLGHLVAPWAM
jgi:hypothetical protein